MFQVKYYFWGYEILYYELSECFGDAEVGVLTCVCGCLIGLSISNFIESNLL